MDNSRDRSREVSTVVGSFHDQPTSRDALGFKPYVEAIADFLSSNDTLPPLTISIEGEWGSGKSSFMLQVKDALSRRSESILLWLVLLPVRAWRVLVRRLSRRDGRPWLWVATLPYRIGKTIIENLKFPDESEVFASKLFREICPPPLLGLYKELRCPICLTVWFNAWRHDKEDALWAAFALEFIRSISHQRSLPLRYWGYFRLFLGRYRWRDGWFEIVRALAVSSALLFGGLALPLALYLGRPDWGVTFKEGLTRIASGEVDWLVRGLPAADDDKHKIQSGSVAHKDILVLLAGLGGSGAYLAMMISLVIKAKKFFGNPIEINLRKFLSSPSYEEKVAFVEMFHEDFKRVLDAFAGSRRVYVFIDDLDRCEVPRAADLMQAFNLLISDDPRLVFVIGMDREKIAAGLAVKHEKILPYLGAGASDLEGAEFDRRRGLDYGYSYLEKFIQVPFRIPFPSIGELERLSAAHSTLGDEPFWWEISESPWWLSGEGGKYKPSHPTKGGDLYYEEPARSSESRGPVVGDEAAAESIKVKVKVSLRLGSELMQKIIPMVSPVLASNPRRLKQFTNIFRLRAYIANEVGLIGRSEDKDAQALTLEQLAKFVVIGICWPGLLDELINQGDLLARLEQAALGKLNLEEISKSEGRWLSNRKLRSLLRYGLVEGIRSESVEGYSLSQLDTESLLTVLPWIGNPQEANYGGDAVEARRPWRSGGDKTYKNPQAFAKDFPGVPLLAVMPIIEMPPPRPSSRHKVD